MQGKSLRCTKCKKEQKRKKAREYYEAQKVMVKCRKCGELFLTIDSRVCPDCLKEAKQEKREAWRKEVAGLRDAPAKYTVLPPAAEKSGKPRGKEPKGDTSSLAHVVWEISLINRLRAYRHKAAVSYGKYSQIRETKAGRAELEAARKFEERLLKGNG